MKQKRLAYMLLLALGCGLTAGVLALQVLRSPGGGPAPDTRGPARGRVAVAVTDLPLGSVLGPEHVRLIDWPEGGLPAGYASSVGEVVGRGLITPVVANEPLLRTKLATKEEGGGLPIVIPEGMRGVSVKVNEVIGVAGFVLPGTKVDVLVTLAPPGEEGARAAPITRVILQNILVLAAGQTIQRDAEGKPQTVAVITLLVSPDDAERLTLASSEGKIQLALRNTLDGAAVQTRGIRTAGLLGEVEPATRVVRSVARPGAARPAGAPVPAPGPVVETYRGGQRTLQTFSSGSK